VYAGDAPDLVKGVVQLNFQLPTSVPATTFAGRGLAAVPIVLQAGDASSGEVYVYAQ
jgi:uncharacterized protein (TIGR03437 family)